MANACGQTMRWNQIDDDIAPGDHFLDRDTIKGVELEGHYLAKVARRLQVQHLHLWAPVRRHNLRAHSTEFVDLSSAGQCTHRGMYGGMSVRHPDVPR